MVTAVQISYAKGSSQTYSKTTYSGLFLLYNFSFYLLIISLKEDSWQ